MINLIFFSVSHLKQKLYNDYQLASILSWYIWILFIFIWYYSMSHAYWFGIYRIIFSEFKGKRFLLRICEWLHFFIYLNIIKWINTLTPLHSYLREMINEAFCYKHNSHPSFNLISIIFLFGCGDSIQ